MGRGDDPVCSACPGHLRHGSSGLYAVGAVVYTGKDMAVYIRRTNPPYSAFGCRYVCFGVEAPYKFALYHNLPFPATRRTAYSAAIRHYYNCIFPVLSMENCTKTEVFGIFYIVRVIFQFYLDFCGSVVYCVRKIPGQAKLPVFP